MSDKMSNKLRFAAPMFPLACIFNSVAVSFLILCDASISLPLAANPMTPIKHLVIILQENRSFDHYFGTYPRAMNPPGEPRFESKVGTPRVNGLTDALLSENPNGVNPFRLSRSLAITCDPFHSYRTLQRAYNGGRLDKFVEVAGPTGKGCDPRIVMGYYDGNTVTALWNYAQHFAMSDSFFSSGFVPSTPAALNLISGQTHGATPADLHVRGSQRTLAGTVIGNARPLYDDCASKGRGKISMSGRNIGDLLNAKDVTWGYFQGGFRPTGETANGKAVCGSAHRNIAGRLVKDYASRHQPFQYYSSTANAHHLPPSSVAMIGQTDRANHQYDLMDFWAAVEAGNLPKVSFLRAPGLQDGHAGYSDPREEQTFLVETVNRLQYTAQWKDMAIIIVYDDSGGWYDHVMPPIMVPSNNVEFDVLFDFGRCGQPDEGAYLLRCGYGPRLPLLVISPYAKVNFVDHTVLNHASILRFIEDNWNLGRIGDQSLDEIATPLTNMFDFDGSACANAIFLDPGTGMIREVGPTSCEPPTR